MSKMIFLFRKTGLILFFGLCIILLSGNVKASADENDVKLNVSDVSITKDGSYRLKVYNLSPEQSVVYRSGNSGIAYVSRTGKVMGLSYGETVITATVIEDSAAVATLQCNVTIGPAAVSVKLTKTNLVLQEGRQKLLTTVLLPLNTVESPVFFSTDTEIAKVSSAGRVRAIAAGSTQVYAFLENGQYAVCNVTVLNEEDYAKYREGISVEEILSENGENAENNTENNSEETDLNESNTEDNSSNGDRVPSENSNTETKSVNGVISDDVAVNE
ncbi:MAG: Ig-like domain-containing protein [Lachnospiraceae bacterium]|nr:Ig-like domain-containing protein [Lachnospiraceae bacterium]